MKKAIDLCIYFSNITHLQNLDDSLKIIPSPAPAIWELMSMSMQVNQTSLAILNDHLYKYYGINYMDDFQRIYFGQETCENLLPTLKSVEQAVEIAKQREVSFTLATPYVSPKGIVELRKIFDYLVSLDQEIEVVVNDFGVLHLINTEYSKLIPVLGRLLIKMKRDPRFSLSGYDIANIEIKNIKKVESNQLEVLQGSSLELPSYQKFLNDKGIERAGMDTIPQGVDPKILKKWGLKIDLYWPWTYITSSRSCAIAAHTQVGKDYHPTDELCEFQCKQFEFTFTSDKRMLPTVQNGNAVWMNCESLYKEFFEAGFDRLIYQPYLPI